MEREQIKKMKWFLRFLAMDLNSLNVKNYLRLCEETADFHVDESTEIVLSGREQSTDFSDESGKQVEIVLSEAEGEADTLDRLNKGLFNLFYLQKDFRNRTKNVFFEIEKMQTKDTGSHSVTIVQKEEILVDIEVKAFNNIDSDSGLQLKTLHIIKADQYRSFYFKFLDCLDGVTLSSFHKCPECEHWFLNPYKKKEKIYCSNRCASRHIVRKKRKDPSYLEGEKERARSRARKSYEKKIKMKSPNAKIDRKPRKKED
jgi:hypothetical protein